jgi:hypothetical protein
MMAFVTIALSLLPINNRPSVIVVVGAAGTPEYESLFQKAADQWQAAAAKGNAYFHLIGRGEVGTESDRERLHKTLLQEGQLSTAPLWIVFLGHGTDDGREARINLRGPDFTAKELADWLAPFHRPLAIVNGASSSGSFINHLSGKNRVVVTATRSGSESNYSRFGQYLAAALQDPEADLDRDGQVSLLEAFLSASHHVAEFYRSESRLATEHALLDDNGDKVGSSADWFQGTRAVKRAKDGALADGIRAHQWHIIPSEQERNISSQVRQRRDQLEQSLAALLDQKSKLGEEEYYQRLEKLMLELARLYEMKNAESKAPGF